MREWWVVHGATQLHIFLRLPTSEQRLTSMNGPEHEELELIQN
jgi:hypothetical protein